MRREVSPSSSRLSDAPPAELIDAPTAELIQLALRQTGDLVRAEASLATAELKADTFGAIVATVNMVAAVVLLALAAALGAVAALLALGASVPAALFTTAGILVVFGVVAGLVGIRLAPRQILEHSRERVGAEIREIEDHAS